MSDDKDKNKNRDRLNSLKSQLMSDQVEFNTDLFQMDTSELPNNFDDIEKPIDYTDKKKELNLEATEEIVSIIDVYIKSEKLLKSARLNAKKRNYVRKYTMLLMVLDLYEANLITIQESIDIGDRSKEQFDLVNKTGAEISKILKDIDNLLIECEDFYEEYSSSFGMESEEEKIISSDTSVVVDDDTVIMTMTDIANAVHEQMKIQKDIERKENEKED